MSTAEQVREAQVGIIQLTGEFARGLTVLESELRIFARISRADGRAEIASTFASLRSLVHLQDKLAPIAMSDPQSGDEDPGVCAACAEQPFGHDNGQCDGPGHGRRESGGSES